jgi:hypothetical protein
MAAGPTWTEPANQKTQWKNARWRQSSDTSKTKSNGTQLRDPSTKTWRHSEET